MFPKPPCFVVRLCVPVLEENIMARNNAPEGVIFGRVVREANETELTVQALGYSIRTIPTAVGWA